MTIMTIKGMDKNRKNRRIFSVIEQKKEATFSASLRELEGMRETIDIMIQDMNERSLPVR